MSKRVRLGLEELYYSGIKELYYGGKIVCYEEDGVQCYTLKNSGDIIACNAELFFVESKTSRQITLRSCTTKNLLFLTNGEFKLGTYDIADDPDDGERRIIVITGANLPEMYYVRSDGTLSSVHNGSSIIRFIREAGIDDIMEYLEIHPDILYNRNGCDCELENKLADFETFKDMPSWYYSKDTEFPLIEQLTDEERIEFDKLNSEE